MPRTCTVCTHASREAIDRAIAAGEPLRGIARRFAASADALSRHRAEHIPELLARAQARREAHADTLEAQVAQQEGAEDTHALDVMDQVRRLFTRVNLLFDACDTWLRDPDDESRYTLEPRSDDVWVIYTERGPAGKPVRKKALLSRLLARLEDGGVDVQRGEYKVADPRKLVLDAAAGLKGQTELLAKLMGDLDERAQVNLVVSPEWAQVRATLIGALSPYPEARVAVSERLVALEGGADRARAG